MVRKCVMADMLLIITLSREFQLGATKTILFFIAKEELVQMRITRNSKTKGDTKYKS